MSSVDFAEFVAVDIGPPTARSQKDKLAPELRAAVNTGLKFVGQRGARPALEGEGIEVASIRAKAMTDDRVRDLTPVETSELVVRTDQLAVFYRTGSPSTRPNNRLAGLTITSTNLSAQVLTIQSNDGFTADQLHQLSASEDVLYAEPDYVYKITREPHETASTQQWGLTSIRKPAQLPPVKQQVLVAVLDTGIDLTHPSLKANLWTNPGEVPDNQIDDDGDGIVDDVHGANYSTVGKITGLPTDPKGHGTHVAGIIAASGPIMGVSPQTKILPVKMLEPTPAGDFYDQATYCSQVAMAMDYAVAHNAKIINCSWGGAYSQNVTNAIIRARNAGVLVICAAGNAESYPLGHDIDEAFKWPSYPASLADQPEMDNLICVAAIDQHDELAPFSHFGKASVHLGAPGVDIYSTWLNGGFEKSTGTSMATPFVSGAAALIWDRQPTTATYHDIRDLILKHVRPAASLLEKSVTGGVLDLSFMTGRVQPPPPTAAAITPTDSTPTTGSAAHATEAVGNVIPDIAAGGETTGLVLRAGDLGTAAQKLELDPGMNAALRNKIVDAMNQKQRVDIKGTISRVQPIEKGLSDRIIMKVDTINPHIGDTPTTKEKP